MKYTSAEASKLVKKLEDRIKRTELAESKSATFNAASGEDAESLRPKYSFKDSQAKLEELQAQVRKVKHAVNCFNVSHTLPGFKDVTVDQALVLIPQLRARLSVLGEMMARLPKERVDMRLRNNQRRRGRGGKEVQRAGGKAFRAAACTGYPQQLRDHGDRRGPGLAG